MKIKLMMVWPVSMLLSSCFFLGSDSDESESIAKLDLASGSYECVTLDTNKGDIILALDSVKAPISVANFLGYTNDEFYDGTIFHRVVRGTLIQGGGFTENLEKKTTQASITNEADNGLLNKRGTIAMARTGVIHSATSQFYINTKDNPTLDHTDTTDAGWGYAVFGQVVNGMDGMDVVDTISTVTTGAGGTFTKEVPNENITIDTARVIACSDVVQ